MSDELRLEEDDHTYWLGNRRIPSVSEIISPVCNFDGVPVEVLERKSEIGKAVHLLAEWHDKGIKIDKASIDKCVEPYFKAWKLFAKDMKPKWGVIEEMRHSDHGFAGTVDRVGEVKLLGPGEWIIDIKTVATVSPATGLQTAAYSKLWGGIYGSITRRAAVQLKKDGTYRVVQFSDPHDWPTFLGLLTTHKWRMKHGIK